MSVSQWLLLVFSTTRVSSLFLSWIILLVKHRFRSARRRRRKFGHRGCVFEPWTRISLSELHLKTSKFSRPYRAENYFLFIGMNKKIFMCFHKNVIIINTFGEQYFYTQNSRIMKGISIVYSKIYPIFSACGGLFSK